MAFQSLMNITSIFKSEHWHLAVIRRCGPCSAAHGSPTVSLTYVTRRASTQRGRKAETCYWGAGAGLGHCHVHKSHPCPLTPAGTMSSTRVHQAIGLTSSQKLGDQWGSPWDLSPKFDALVHMGWDQDGAGVQGTPRGSGALPPSHTWFSRSRGENESIVFTYGRIFP